MARARVRSSGGAGAGTGAGASNGGILGSGIFGHLGGIVSCDSKDNSYYCNFIKFMTILMYLFLLVAILYFVYDFLSRSGFRILPKSLYKVR